MERSVGNSAIEIIKVPTIILDEGKKAQRLGVCVLV